ncbi:hypothetical protein AB5N19_01275 [Seiridium cardinale]
MAILTTFGLVPSFAALGFSCIHSKGSIVVDPYLGEARGGISAELWDYGGKVCNGPWHTDQDDHFSATCNPGYTFAVSENGRRAWYDYGSNAFSCDQSPKSHKGDCYRACGEKTGLCIYCTTEISWGLDTYC